MAANVLYLLDAVTTQSSGIPVRINTFPAQVQVVLSDTTTPAATVIVEGSNEGTPSHWFPIFTFTMSGSGETTGRAFAAEWRWVRGRVSAISGASAAVTAIISGKNS